MNFVSGIHGDHGPLAMLPRLCQCAANTLSTNCRVDSRRLKVSARARASSSGGLDFAKAAEATSNQLSARNLAEWNMHKVSASVISVDHAAEIASRVLIQRIAAIHRYLPHGHALGVRTLCSPSTTFSGGHGAEPRLVSPLYRQGDDPGDLRDVLLPALGRIAKTIRQHAPGREIEAFGLPALPAAAALGCAFLSTTGLRASWRQIAPGRDDQLWTLAQQKEDSGFAAKIMSKEPRARDLAVLVSVTDNTEPVFAAHQKNLPPLRALVHITRPGPYPHLIRTPGEATDVALAVQDGMRTARREYGNIGTTHLFMAVPAEGLSR